MKNVTVLALQADEMAAQIVREATALAVREPLLGALLRRRIGTIASLAAILISVLAAEVECAELDYSQLKHLFRAVYSEHPEIIALAAYDIDAVLRRDPASDSQLSVVLDQKGFQALSIHRVAHVLWNKDRRPLARRIQATSSRRFGVDIHPACRVGRAVMLDHATGIVMGETVLIGDNVSIMQGVTLGGTGKERGDRHPKVGDGVLIGAGATLLGNIQVGKNARIGAGSVVLGNVPAGSTFVGVPARVRVRAYGGSPGETMDHCWPRD